MYLSDGWKDYELLNAGGGEKYERWGDVRLLRPDPQAVWPMRGELQPDAVYHRSASGGGHWDFRRPLPEGWPISYGELRFLVRPTGFKHTGLFPEQAVNWDWMRARLKNARDISVRSTTVRSTTVRSTTVRSINVRSINVRSTTVLNLFAYTGGATCACAMEGAQVVHVDAAKGMIGWAKENCALCGLADAPIRFLVDDAMKFVLRENRRGNRYDAILMDPPSYGRGPGGEMWKIEQDLYPLVEAAAALLSDTPVFFLINSYTTGLAPSVLQNVLHMALDGKNAHIEAADVGLPITGGPGLVLPCGASGRAWWD